MGRAKLRLRLPAPGAVLITHSSPSPRSAPTRAGHDREASHQRA